MHSIVMNNEVEFGEGIRIENKNDGMSLFVEAER